MTVNVREDQKAGELMLNGRGDTDEEMKRVDICSVFDHAQMCELCRLRPNQLRWNKRMLNVFTDGQMSMS